MLLSKGRCPLSLILLLLLVTFGMLPTSCGSETLRLLYVVVVLTTFFIFHVYHVSLPCLVFEPARICGVRHISLHSEDVPVLHDAPFRLGCPQH